MPSLLFQLAEGTVDASVHIDVPAQPFDPIQIIFVADDTAVAVLDPFVLLIDVVEILVHRHMAKHGRIGWH